MSRIVTGAAGIVATAVPDVVATAFDFRTIRFGALVAFERVGADRRALVDLRVAFCDDFWDERSLVGIRRGREKDGTGNGCSCGSGFLRQFMLTCCRTSLSLSHGGVLFNA